MRNVNRVVLSSGSTVGSYRLVQLPDDSIVTEELTGYDSLGNSIWIEVNFNRSTTKMNDFIQTVGTRLGSRIDTKARARRERYEERNPNRKLYGRNTTNKSRSVGR